MTYHPDTKLMGLLGYPLGHSIIPELHNELYHRVGINAVLQAMQLEDASDTLSRFFNAVRLLPISGFIVTMPYKTKMLPYLDVVPEKCRVFNCVNAVRYENGKLYGEALDGYGMCRAIENTGASLSGRHALILGAGGISGMVAAEMAARGVESFTILNRTKEKAEQLAGILCGYTGKHVYAGSLTKEELDRAATRADLVAQCTSAGMYGTNTRFPYLGFVERLHSSCVVVDALYNPPQSEFLKAVAANGLTAINGMGMLSNQVSALIQFFFGIDLDSEGTTTAASILNDIMNGMRKEQNKPN